MDKKETTNERLNRMTRDLASGKIPEEMKAALQRKRLGGTPVKHPFRHVINFEWFRDFTLWERIKILLGYNLEVSIRVPCLNNPGELGVLVMATTSVHTEAKGLLTEKAKEALQEVYGNQIPKP